jgi:hypothetical protein
MIAAGGGALLFVFLFVSWFSAGPVTWSAWQLFSIADIVLAILALTVTAVALSRVLDFELPIPWLRPELLRWLGAIALTITLTLIIELSNGKGGGLSIELGGYVAILASLAIVAGAILAEQPELAARLEAGVDSARRSSGIAAPSDPDAGAPAATRAPAPAATSPAAGATARTPTPAAPTTGGGAAATGAAASAGSGGPPAGWYPDPQGQARLRYWDGIGWTDQTSA